MAKDRSDEAMVGRMIGRVKLLIALSDEIPIETKLNTQQLIKMFEAALEEPGAQSLSASYYRQLYDDLSDYPDLEALLSAMRTFLPHV